LITTALLGGSFNPAHPGHRRISLAAARALGVAEVWWLVSPGNPLKPAKGMAPLAARFASAQSQARRSIIRPTAIERQLGTRYTVDTIAALVRLYPKRRFIWLMGEDNLVQFPQWRDWRKIARTVPIAVIVRPGYSARAKADRAFGWLRRFVHPAAQVKHWTEWRPPALVLLRFRPDPSSATAIRRNDPDWHRPLQHKRLRDPVSRRVID
jgi:nicotinate-nucleotide adenylyltransferase